MEKGITVTVNETELHFTVTLADYNKYLNELTPNNKVAPARNFLMRTVDAQCKEALREMVDLPGVGVQVAAALIEEYMPDVNITVGK
ncbi:putative phage tail assembly chaperone [uncultured Desulfovibrio sp.]|uniref:putative phage tail assembly chaperone n=1 Tax=uncultured Desulfovibrio sp. TaxID=167968 RepID=UPI0020582758|nr:putative phage tail assembly chaperone [uncultured Desulfovibrio sp.]DAT79976.1 MAG TPA: tail assembly chaperone protein [Caudoviricetes sp.]